MAWLWAPRLPSFACACFTSRTAVALLISKPDRLLARRGCCYCRGCRLHRGACGWLGSSQPLQSAAVKQQGMQLSAAAPVESGGGGRQLPLRQQSAVACVDHCQRWACCHCHQGYRRVGAAERQAAYGSCDAARGWYTAVRLKLAAALSPQLGAAIRAAQGQQRPAGCQSRDSAAAAAASCIQLACK